MAILDQFNVLDISDQIDRIRFGINQGEWKEKVFDAFHFYFLSTKTQGEWKEKVIGAGTLTKDFSRKSYFIQIFDVQQRQKVNLNIFKDEHYPVKSSAFGCVLPCARRR